MTPFDTGAYASRQSYVTGNAVKQCALQLKEKILAYARTLLNDTDRELTLDRKMIYMDGEEAISLEEVAMESYYSLTNSSAITAEVSLQTKGQRPLLRRLLCGGGGGYEAGQGEGSGYYPGSRQRHAFKSPACHDAGPRRNVHGAGLRTVGADAYRSQDRPGVKRYPSGLQASDRSGRTGSGRGVCGGAGSHRTLRE